MRHIIHCGMEPPAGRPDKTIRSKLPGLIATAKEMALGDCVELTLSEAGTFRIILLAMGYECRTDGWRCKTRGKILAFKMNPE